MPKTIPETIYPCPFSKSYGIPGRQAWLILKIYLVYRFILACLFVILFHSRFGPSLLGSYDQQLYIISSGLFLLVTLISAIGVFWRLTSYAAQAQILIFTDILFITLIMHACGGIASGTGMLLVVSMAAGGLLIGGRCAILFAALATLAILAEQIYADTNNTFDGTTYTYAGMLGAAFFTIALLTVILAERTEKSERLADQRKKTISKLETLNQVIIQHFQSGMIICDKNQRVSMINETASYLLGFSGTPEALPKIDNQLSDIFRKWRKNPSQHFFFIKTSQQNEIQIHFQKLPVNQETYFLIMLEDMAVYNQRLQQSKLASLGRLTASIAHEIRNPLGAISHAGQLLSECPDLTPQDQRLTGIIQSHAQRVNTIIEDILQLSRRNASKKQKIELGNWLHHYLENFLSEHNINPNQFILSIENIDLYALADPGHLKQIMDNLCRNALNYGCPEKGKITIKCYYLLTELVIDVMDPGQGIAPNDLEHLFEPFFTTSMSGTGLGLYISRELAQLNQAKLDYYNTAGQSCFRLVLIDANKND